MLGYEKVPPPPLLFQLNKFCSPYLTKRGQKTDLAELNPEVKNTQLSF